MTGKTENNDATVLVTGGAGYIGSHVVEQLLAENESVVVIDDLSNGYRDAVGDADLYVGDVSNSALVEDIITTHRVKTIMHFAAAMIVSESVANPGKYYRNNTGGTASLLECAANNDVEHFVFSSTAAVYGIPEGGICQETSPTQPINPYGRSKLMSEEMLRDISAATAMRHVILRYFNVAGADSSGDLGQRGNVSTHITKIACEVAVGKRNKLDIYGADYDTPDGTCVRDYIHVVDLAAAHVAALSYLRGDGDSTTLNCGYGDGYSVRDVIQAVERAAGEPLSVEESQRRVGDPPVLIAAVEKIRKTLHWKPQYDDLDLIAKSALEWERTLLERT